WSLDLRSRNLNRNEGKKSFFNWYMSLRFCAPRGLEALIVEAKKKGYAGLLLSHLGRPGSVRIDSISRASRPIPVFGFATPRTTASILTVWSLRFRVRRTFVPISRKPRVQV